MIRNTPETTHGEQSQAPPTGSGGNTGCGYGGIAAVGTNRPCIMTGLEGCAGAPSMSVNGTAVSFAHISAANQPVRKSDNLPSRLLSSWGASTQVASRRDHTTKVRRSIRPKRKGQGRHSLRPKR